MKIDVEEILRRLEGKANTIYFDRDRLKNLLNSTKKKVEGNKTLMEVWEDIKLFLDLLKDWMRGDYREISKGSIIMIIISLLYLVNPLDLIPDFLVAGFIDDLAVIAYVIKKISDELNVYKKWKFSNDNEDSIEVEVEIVEDVINVEDVEDIDHEENNGEKN
ncbi:YkvA family protein [Tissierella carlieri]|uniref:YkvA family protein n=1 Tax=Tissierella carlieri TaxID=689904 RepID=A0ABT1S8G5_9FIRM|nr:YkvA family protein [Tissierella carlieri]MCQ4922765.1 YkvA family protein [Tissierella carlieri]